MCPWTRSYAKSPFLGATCVSRRGFCRFSTFISPRKDNGAQKAELGAQKAQKIQCRSKTSSTSVISSGPGQATRRANDPERSRAGFRTSRPRMPSCPRPLMRRRPPTPATPSAMSCPGHCSPAGWPLRLLAWSSGCRRARAAGAIRSRLHPHRMLSVADHCLRSRNYVNLI